MKLTTIRTILSAIILASLYGCDILNVNDSDKQPDVEFCNVTKIIWVLDSYIKDGIKQDLDGYAPQHLVVQDSTQIIGDDGCNQFYITYKAEENRITPSDLSITLSWCEEIKSFSPHYLQQPFEVNIESNIMNLFFDDGVYQYRSDYMQPVSESPLIDNQWKLFSSTDTGINELRGEYTPSLTFDVDRNFSLDWRCTDDNRFGCNSISGVWGIGKENRVRFYHTSGRGSNGSHIRTISRIIDSSSFQVEKDTLYLTNPTASAVHKFQMVN